LVRPSGPAFSVGYRTVIGRRTARRKKVARYLAEPPGSSSPRSSRANAARLEPYPTPALPVRCAFRRRAPPKQTAKHRSSGCFHAVLRESFASSPTPRDGALASRRLGVDRPMVPTVRLKAPEVTHATARFIRPRATQPPAEAFRRRRTTLSGPVSRALSNTRCCSQPSFTSS
jgi:hypothetical protein